MMPPFLPHCGGCGSPMPKCMCHAHIAPTMPAPQPVVTRFRKAGFYTVCEICGLAVEWCKGHALPEFGSEPTSDLQKRIREAQGR